MTIIVLLIVALIVITITINNNDVNNIIDIASPSTSLPGERQLTGMRWKCYH